MFARADFLLNTANTLNLQFDFNRVHATNMDDGSTRSIAPIDNSALLTGDSYWVRGSLTTLFGSSTSQPVSGAMGAGPAHHDAQLDHSGGGD